MSEISWTGKNIIGLEIMIQKSLNIMELKRNYQAQWDTLHRFLELPLQWCRYRDQHLPQNQNKVSILEDARWEAALQPAIAWGI